MSDTSTAAWLERISNELDTLEQSIDTLMEMEPTMLEDVVDIFGSTGANFRAATLLGSLRTEGEPSTEHPSTDTRKTLLDVADRMQHEDGQLLYNGAVFISRNISR